MKRTHGDTKATESILDIKVAKQYGSPKLKIALIKTNKGVSLYAIAPIKKRSIVAYYKFCVYKDIDYEGIRNNSYTVGIYNKNGNLSNTLIGDICVDSLDFPQNNIPYWGYFANEPDLDDEANVDIDLNIAQNYKNRLRVRPGESMVYKLKANRDIEPGEEICWCYGDADYERNYETSCFRNN